VPPRAFIALRDVRKSYGEQRVLQGVDLEIREGETLVILGASGSGKSVLLRHVIGLESPDSGSIEVDGQEITGFSERELLPVRRKVGMLFQGGALFDSMTVYENVAFPLREHTRWEEERIAARVRAVLGLVGLEAAEEKMPSELSGGMKKRAALARAVALEPRALLYDEPTTGLDPVTVRTILELIRGMQSRLGVTSVVVTHDIESAFRVCDRLAFLWEGRIRFAGTRAEAERAEDAALRRFLAARAGGDA
jgi:phospholipid/cholesterol/gamma-HCH transport system ATP-binding protein